MNEPLFDIEPYSHVVAALFAPLAVVDPVRHLGILVLRLVDDGIRPHDPSIGVSYRRLDGRLSELSLLKSSRLIVQGLFARLLAR